MRVDLVTRLAGVVAVLLTSGCTPAGDTAAGAAYADTIADCRITDGDTIRCGAERIRLLGIDAPELPGHCRPGRRCASGDGGASAASLGQALTGHITIERVGEDRYGRTLALVAGSGGDLSCWQLSHAEAIYRADWDNGGRVARTCPSLTADPTG